MWFGIRSLKVRIILVLFASIATMQITSAILVIQRYNREQEEAAVSFMQENLTTVATQVETVLKDMVKISNILTDNEYLIDLLRERLPDASDDVVVQRIRSEIADYRLSADTYRILAPVEKVLESAKTALFFNYMADVLIQQEEEIVYVSADTYSDFQFKMLTMDHLHDGGSLVPAFSASRVQLQWAAPFTYPTPGLDDVQYLSLYRNIVDPVSGFMIGTLMVNVDIENLQQFMPPDSSTIFNMYNEESELVFTSNKDNTDALLDLDTHVMAGLDVGRTGWYLESWRSHESAYAVARTMRNLSGLISFFTFLAGAGITLYSVTLVLQPLQRVIDSISHVVIGNYRVEKPANTALMDIESLEKTIDAMIRRINILVDQSHRDERHAQELRLDALRAQIDPHFIFNTLESIKWMISLHGHANISKAIDDLCCLLVDRFKQDSNKVTVGHEIEQIQHYVALQNIRYLDGIDLHISVESGLESHQIPRMIIQPLVENSIVHGYTDDNHFFHIHIAVSTIVDLLSIQVCDNGWKHGEDNRPGHGTALANIAERIRLAYGQSGGIEFSRQDNISTAEIWLPLHSKEET